MEFVNRQSELHSLQLEYEREESSFVVLYGRRRLGKTALVQEFLKKQTNAFYFMADKEHDQFQMNKLKTVFTTRFGDTFLEDSVFDTWDKVFDYLISRADFSNRLILAIDEFQHLAMVNPSFPSIFQRIWDTKLKDKNIMLIVCGSHVSMMYSTLLSYDSPLYGRRTSSIKLKPIAFKHWEGFFKEKASLHTQVEFYAITSGIPKYIELLNRKKGAKENIASFMANKDQFFYTEPRFLLHQEVQDTTYYFSILRAISMGDHKLGHIAGRMGVSGQKLTQYLDVLRDLEIVERRVPITELKPEKSRKGLYYIKDYFIRFWFRFIYPYQSYLEMGDNAVVMQKVDQDLNGFIALVFEDIARQLLTEYSPFPFTRIGAHWSKDGEIDVVAFNENTAQYIYGECKWQNEPMDIRHLQKLMAKAAQVKWLHEEREEYFVLFSKSGFTKELLAMTKETKTLILIDFSGR